MKNRNTIAFVLLGLAVLALLVADVAVGSVSIGFRRVLAVLTGSEHEETIRYIVLNFRVPKSIMALLAGAALSASGLQMQTLFRNPLAGPFVLGISSGASLGVSIFLLGLPMLGATAATDMIRDLGTVGAAWAGSALILLVIMVVTTRIRDVMAILILGMMFGSAATALVEILQYLSPESALKSFVVWTMGSLGGVSLSQLKLIVPVIAVGLALSIALIKPLNLLLLGENYARTMGLDIRRWRAVIFVSTTLLAGSITAFCGPIGFIGLAVPHVARMLFRRADHRTLMPASMLLGSAVMLGCDLVSQFPGYDITLPINTITALVGIPVVVIVIVRKRKFF